jgi:hypothetical protein
MPSELHSTEMPAEKRWMLHCKNDCGQHLAQAILPILNTALRDINIRLCNSERLFCGSDEGMKTKAALKEIYLAERAGKLRRYAQPFEIPMVN